MNAILTIALRELRVQFLSPLAWTLLGVLFAIAAYMFNASITVFQMQQMQFSAMGGGQDLSVTEWTASPVVGNIGVMLLLVLPLFTMRLIADEKRRETWPALASSPITPMQIILGKYVGFLFFLLITVLLIGLLPLSLLAFTDPDLGMILAGLLGLFLLGAAFGAVGLAASAATDNPIVAALMAFGVLLMLWILSWMGGNGTDPLDKVLNYLSLTGHFQQFLKGIVTTSDLSYFLLLIVAGLLFARHRLLAEQIRG